MALEGQRRFLEGLSAVARRVNLDVAHLRCGVSCDDASKSLGSRSAFSCPQSYLY